MARLRYQSSRPDSWNVPRSNLHPSERKAVYGAIQPMEPEPKGWLRRLFGRR